MTNEKDPEEAQFSAYMEGANAGSDVPQDTDRKTYYYSRLKEIRDAYKQLLIEKEEIDGYKNAAHREPMVAKLLSLFRTNYLARVRIVTELRKLGEVVEDPFVPSSKTA